MKEKRLCLECGKPLFSRKPQQSLASYAATKMHPTCAMIRAQRALNINRRRARELERARRPLDVGACALVVLRAIKSVYGDVYGPEFPAKFDEVERKIERGEKP